MIWNLSPEKSEIVEESSETINATNDNVGALSKMKMNRPIWKKNGASEVRTFLLLQQQEGHIQKREFLSTETRLSLSKMCQLKFIKSSAICHSLLYILLNLADLSMRIRQSKGHFRNWEAGANIATLQHMQRHALCTKVHDG